MTPAAARGTAAGLWLVAAITCAILASVALNCGGPRAERRAAAPTPPEEPPAAHPAAPTASGGEPAATCPQRGALPGSGTTRRFHLAEDGCAGHRVDALAGEWVEIRVEQWGADVVARLEAPSGTVMAEVDSPIAGFGDEVVAFVAQEDGHHRLTVRAFPGSSGEYRLRRAARRRAGEADRRRAAVRAALAAAEADGADAPARLESLAAAADHLGDPFLAGEVAHRRARFALAAGRFDEAARHAGTAAGHFADADDPPRRAVAVGLQGRALFEAGRVSAARRAFEAAVALYAEPGSVLAADPAGRAVALHNLAHAWQWEGRPQRALETYARAVASARAAGATASEADSRHNRGVVLLGLGRDSAASSELAAAARLYRRLGRPAAEAASLDKLGVVLLRRADPRALDHLRRVLARRDRHADPQGWAVTASQLGIAWRRRGEPLPAIAAQRAALQALGVVVDPPAAAGDGGDAGDGGEADLDVAARRVAAAALHNLALVERDLGAPSLGRQRRALDLYVALGDGQGEAEVRGDLARSHLRRGELPQARRQAEAALDLFESRRALPDDTDLRADWFATVQQHYALAASVRMALHQRQPRRGHAAAALAIHERARARSLLDLRLDARDRRGAAADPRGAAGGHPTPIPAAEPLPVAELRRRLVDPDSAVLIYGLGDEASYLWVLDETGLATFRLPPRQRIEELAEGLVNLLAVSHRAEGRAALGRALCAAGRTLLDPAAPRLADRSRWVVIADGALAALPFAALPEPAPPPSTPPSAVAPAAHPEACEGRLPVVARRVVTQPPSATLAALRRGGPTRAAATRDTLLVFADPVYGPDDPRLAGKGAAAARAWVGPRVGPGRPALPRLPATAAEARAIAAAAASTPGASVRLHLGLAATPRAVRAAAPAGHRALHLAVHATVDLERPDASALWLSRQGADGAAGGGEPADDADGALTAGAIRRLPVACDLVVLSVCRSGVGRRVPGEGMLGLGRAFLEAGAGQVLVSLWPVDDAATAELMGRFYAALLGRGLDPAAALAEAQRSLAAEPGRAPYHWAGFVLQG